MGIKLADTLEPMGNFPAVESSNVEITLTGGTKKNLQTAYDDGDLGGGSGSIDTAMSDSSTNAVQNKVIKQYVDENVTEAITQVMNTGF